jgi:hypothetical protein
MMHFWFIIILNVRRLELSNISNIKPVIASKNQAQQNPYVKTEKSFIALYHFAPYHFAPI